MLDYDLISVQTKNVLENGHEFSSYNNVQGVINIQLPSSVSKSENGCFGYKL